MERDPRINSLNKLHHRAFGHINAALDYDENRDGMLTGGFDTKWDGHHDGGVVGRGVQFLLSENALSGQNLH